MPEPGGTRPSVLVTGTSTGIGRACAARLVSDGFRVFAGVRRTADARSLTDELGPAVTPLMIDVTDQAQIAEAADTIAKTAGGHGLDGLINNAGIVAAGPLEYLPLAEFRRQLEVNTVGAVAVTQAVLPLLRQTTGRIVMISSISGRSALPIVGAYSASKFALEAVSDALRLELRRWGIHVAIIEPGRIDTPIWNTSIERAERNLDAAPPELEERYGPLLRSARARATLTAGPGPMQEAVDAVVHALTAKRPRVRYLIGRDARRRLLVERLPVRLRDWLIAKQLERLSRRA
jgi:NAD(P)-dependent dehydrogenase (short-subunit alcohol dehydrogenase family)